MHLAIPLQRPWAADGRNRHPRRQPANGSAGGSAEANGGASSQNGDQHVKPSTEEPPALSRVSNRNFQSYRGTWAWLSQRISAICLFLLIPLKIYTGWGIRGKVPY